ncbi:MAG: hypothetical protein ACRDK0_08660 [Solirubrobacteraceae bacterium]
MVIAGPVFPEWYWGPIFFLILYSPLIAATGVALYLVLRRWGRPTLRSRLLRAGASLLGAIALVPAGTLVWQHVAFERAQARDARAIRFAVFEPRAGFRATRAQVHAGVEPSVHWTYERGGGTFFASQRAPARLDELAPPECRVSSGARHSGFSGPCEPRRTPRGRDVLLARGSMRPYDRYLFADLDGTIVVAFTVTGSEADLLAYADALERVAPGDIDFKR